VVPIIFVASIIFSQFIWSLAAIPSDAYPYANVYWDINAREQLLMYSSTTGGQSLFYDALKPGVLGIGIGVGLGMFAILNALSLPTLFIYGVVQGFGHTDPHGLIFQLMGALLGRYYFERRFTRDRWRQYAPVLLAGYGCGVGLISAGSVAVGMLSKSVSQLLY